MESLTCYRCKKDVLSHQTLRSEAAAAQGGRVCTSCARTSSNAVDSHIDYTAGTATPPWLRAIGLIEFDLQLGIVVRYLNPPLPFSHKQEAEIAFLCFPDANLMDDGDSVHDFVYAFNPAECDHRRTTIRREQEDGSGSASPTSTGSGSGERAGYAEDHQEFFATALFRQKRDPSVTRGARQNAIVILGDYPFPAIYRRILAQLVNYLDTPDVDAEQFLLSVSQSLSQWPMPVPNMRYNELPLIGTTLSFCTPDYRVDHIWSIPQPSIELSCHRLTDRQRLLGELYKTPRNMNAIIALTSTFLRSAQADTLNKLHQCGWDDEARCYAKDLTDEQVIAIAGALVTAEIPPSSVDGSDPKVKRLLTHFRHGTGPSKEIVALQNAALHSLHRRFSGLLETVHSEGEHMSPLRPSDRRPVFAEIQVNHALFPHITKLWKFWELMITGSPLAIIGPNAPVVSAIALSIASLTDPMPFTGLLRPYLTINNREIDHCIKSTPQPSSIVAATNPFFVRHLQKWPHFLCVGNPDADVQTHKTLPADSEKRTKQQFKLKNRMFCSRHYLVKTDKSFHDAFLKAPPGKGSFVQDDAAAPSTEIRNVFRSLTNDFLDPLRSYIANVLGHERPFFLPESELRALFSHTKMLEAVQNSSPQVFSRFKTTTEALAVYETFLTSSTYQAWLQREISSHYRKFLLDADCLEDVILMQPYSSMRHEVMSRLQWDFERELDAPLLDVELLQKLASLTSLIPALRVVLCEG